MTAQAVAATQSLYETPWHVPVRGDAYFYHKMTLPGHGEIWGDWDIRECADAYLGNHDFAGKRVLDVGTASGFLTFEMEKRGADVVSFDIDDGANWDIVPHFVLNAEKFAEIKTFQSNSLRRLKSGYWFSHKALNSKARAHYGNIYAMDDRLGLFDTIMFGMIIGHLRDIPQAIWQGARRCKDTMLIPSIYEKSEDPIMRWVPRPEKTNFMHFMGWWTPTHGMMRQMLATMGFEITAIVPSDPVVQASNDFPRGNVPCETIVARRVNGKPLAPDV